MNKELPSVLIPQQSVEMSNVDIHTEILEPVNKSQSRLQFNIKKQGLLNSGSRLVLSVHNDDAARFIMMMLQLMVLVSSLQPVVLLA
jgi:hypothetical protein